MGSWQMFTLAMVTLIVWALSGPLFHFSDTWQLVINTSTTIFTFITGILMLYSQNRDMTAVHLKLDEIILSISTARNEFIAVELDEDTELEKLEEEMEDVHRRLAPAGLGPVDRQE